MPLLIHIGFYPLKHHTEFGAIEKLQSLLAEYKLNIVVCHGGGEHWKKLAELSESYDFYADLSLCSFDVMENLCRKMGSKRLLFGSDYPLGSPRRRINIISKIARGRDLERILHSNALRLFG